MVGWETVMENEVVLRRQSFSGQPGNANAKIWRGNDYAGGSKRRGKDQTASWIRDGKDQAVGLTAFPELMTSRQVSVYSKPRWRKRLLRDRRL